MKLQIQQCQQTPEYHGHTIDYIGSYEYHKRRHKADDRQLFCKTCQRWKYPRQRTVGGFSCNNDVLCSIAVTVPRLMCIHCETKRHAKDEMLCQACLNAINDDPYNETIYHMADKVNQRGGVSALCFTRPRAISLSRACWTLRPEAVTCKKCLALLEKGETT